MNVGSFLRNNIQERTNIFRVLICNILLAYAVLFVCRIIFLLVNYNLYSAALLSNDWWLLLKGSLLFDTASVCYLNAAYVLFLLFPLHYKENKIFKAITKCVYIIPNALGVIVNLSDCIYVPYTGRRTTWSVFSEFGNESNITSIIGKEIISNWWLVLIGFTIIWLIYKLYTPAKNSTVPLKRYYIKNALLLVFSTIYIVFGMRGNIGKEMFMISSNVVRPISMSSANQYVTSPNETPIVLNTPYSIIRNIGKKLFSEKNYFTPDELEHIYSPVRTYAAESSGKGKNVVVIIIESFGKEYIGTFNPRTEGTLTPFLDSLIGCSRSYLYSYGNGKKSIDGMPSILSSIPMFEEPFFLTPFSLNSVSGIAGELSKVGYNTAFYHGGPNSSMGFQAFAKTTGFESYYGMDEYCLSPEHDGMGDYDGTWAIWDEPFLQYFANELNNIKEPFAASVFTASSHHPFNIPQKYKDIYKDGPNPFTKCIQYTDHALRMFFNSASKYDWFKNTLFVITADHTNQSKDARYLTSSGGFEVPVIFYLPSGSAPFEPKMDSIAVAQQIDIMPTVLDYLGYDKPFIAFGKSLISTPAQESCAVNFNNGIYQYYKNEYLLLFDGEKSTALYNIRKDPLMTNNIISESNVHIEMEQEVKAIIQQYMHRIINDKLTLRN